MRRLIVGRRWRRLLSWNSVSISQTTRCPNLEWYVMKHVLIGGEWESWRSVTRVEPGACVETKHFVVPVCDGTVVCRRPRELSLNNHLKELNTFEFRWVTPLFLSSLINVALDTRSTWLSFQEGCRLLPGALMWQYLVSVGVSLHWTVHSDWLELWNPYSSDLSHLNQYTSDWNPH